MQSLSMLVACPPQVGLETFRWGMRILEFYLLIVGVETHCIAINFYDQDQIKCHRLSYEKLSSSVS